MMALNYVCLAFLMLYLSGDAMATTADCIDTPWSNMCKVHCTQNLNDRLTVIECTNTTLSAGSYEDQPAAKNINFNNIQKVSTNAFRNYSVNDLYLTVAVTMIENDAFNNLTVKVLSIEKNAGLVALPSRVFNGVIGLEWLRIHGNGIQSLPGDILKGLDKLTKLTLIEPSLSCLAYNIFKPTKALSTVNFIDEYDAYGLKGQEKELPGFCPQTFMNMNVELKYKFALDKCAIECSSGMSFNNFIDDTKICDCDESIDGCVDSNCKAITMDALDGMDGMDEEKDGMDGDKDGDDDGDDGDMDSGSPGSNPGFGYLRALAISVILWILTGV